MSQIRKLTRGKTVQYFASDIAKGLFNGMIGNYLLYFFQPTAASGLPGLLPESKLLGYITIMAVLTGISKIVDAVTDPLVANISDKCKSAQGRRMPFMRIAAVPYALCVVLIFLAPFSESSVGNAIWVGFFLVAYYVFYTVYYIPNRALIPEIIPDAKQRVSAYALSTVFFMGSSAFMYAATLFVSLFKRAGLDALWAWRAVFIIFGCIGLACLLLTAFAFKEKDYVCGARTPQDSLLKSIKTVFKNKDFVVFAMGDLFSYISMAFFQTSMLYYITVLINIPESQAFLVMLTAIATAICFFPLIVTVCKKYNKRTPLIIASCIFTAVFGAIFFGNNIASLFAGKELVLGILMGLCVAFPFAAINIIPQSVVSDIIQADSLRSGTNREGFYYATKTFMEKVAYAVAMVIVSSLLAIGALAGEKVGLMGVKLTGIFAGAFSLVSTVFFFLYNDKKVTDFIAAKTASDKSDSDEIADVGHPSGAFGAESSESDGKNIGTDADDANTADVCELDGETTE